MPALVVAIIVANILWTSADQATVNTAVPQPQPQPHSQQITSTLRQTSSQPSSTLRQASPQPSSTQRQQASSQPSPITAPAAEIPAVTSHAETAGITMEITAAAVTNNVENTIATMEIVASTAAAAAANTIGTAATAGTVMDTAGTTMKANTITQRARSKHHNGGKSCGPRCSAKPSSPALPSQPQDQAFSVDVRLYRCDDGGDGDRRERKQRRRKWRKMFPEAVGASTDQQQQQHRTNTVIPLSGYPTGDRKSSSGGGGGGHGPFEVPADQLELLYTVRRGDTAAVSTTAIAGTSHGD